MKPASGVLLVESVIPLSADQLKKIHENLSKKVKGIAQVENKVNTSLIGGLRLSFQGSVIDMSIRTRLAELDEHLR